MGATAEPPPHGSDGDRTAARDNELRGWIFGEHDARRFTQDSAVLPQVWLDYVRAPHVRHDLLLTPEAHSNAGALASALAAGLVESDRRETGLAYNESYVVAHLTLPELVRAAVPLSAWWPRLSRIRAAHLGEWIEEHRRTLRRFMRADTPHRPSGPRGELIWYIGLVGRIGLIEEPGADIDPDAILSTAAELLDGISTKPTVKQPLLWTVNPNRVARTTLHRSRAAIKADAVARVFDVCCSTLCWAIVDAGVDATHPAFRRRDTAGKLSSDPYATRVRRTYDFTRLRPMMSGKLPAPEGQATEALDTLEERLRLGRAIDWAALEPLLRIEHTAAAYKPPTGEHGTHVAGILAADWRATDPKMPLDHDLVGVCHDIELYDLRVFDDSGHGEEFPITAALQFVRHLNAHSDLQILHGANLSLAIDHNVRNYACGRTPICDECDRLVASGVVVAVAAGNEGRAQYTGDYGVTDGYRTASITDPGNAERVLTVGATHRYQPHTYGVSYFSSRGPTGDGRRKPDLVAPGERIQAPVPGGGAKVKDGTSQAAPHVSGAAALLMARHEELRGKPERIKQLLCATATDLGREPNFQGAGMLDVLRAMQEV